MQRNISITIYLIIITICCFKNPSFLLKYLQKIKALQQMPKGLECLGSPYWTRLELLKGILK